MFGSQYIWIDLGSVPESRGWIRSLLISCALNTEEIDTSLDLMRYSLDGYDSI